MDTVEILIASGIKSRKLYSVRIAEIAQTLNIACGEYNARLVSPHLTKTVSMIVEPSQAYTKSVGP